MAKGKTKSRRNPKRKTAACGFRMENYCDECDAVINTYCNEDDFWKFKVGRVRCHRCGAVMMPCNECFGSEYHGKCGECPWRNAAILDEPLVEWGLTISTGTGVPT